MSAVGQAPMPAFLAVLDTHSSVCHEVAFRKAARWLADVGRGDGNLPGGKGMMPVLSSESEALARGTLRLKKCGPGPWWRGWLKGGPAYLSPRADPTFQSLEHPWLLWLAGRGPAFSAAPPWVRGPGDCRWPLSTGASRVLAAPSPDQWAALPSTLPEAAAQGLRLP